MDSRQYVVVATRRINFLDIQPMRHAMPRAALLTLGTFRFWLWHGQNTLLCFLGHSHISDDIVRAYGEGARSRHVSQISKRQNHSSKLGGHFSCFSQILHHAANIALLSGPGVSEASSFATELGRQLSKILVDDAGACSGFRRGIHGRISDIWFVATVGLGGRLLFRIAAVYTLLRHLMGEPFDLSQTTSKSYVHTHSAPNMQCRDLLLNLVAKPPKRQSHSNGPRNVAQKGPDTSYSFKNHWPVHISLRDHLASGCYPTESGSVTGAKETNDGHSATQRQGGSDGHQ